MNLHASAKLLAVLSLCTACGSSSDEPLVTVRDSAGIEIVESPGPRWKDGEGWTLSAEPILEIGVSEGDDAYLLDRVTDAIRFPDGTVVVANAGDNTLRYYDASGEFLHSAGGKGGGPGEFNERIAGLRRFGDSVLAWQFALQPSKLFDHEGNFVRALGAPRRPSRIEGVLADGSHLSGLRFADQPPTGDFYLDSSYVYLSAPDFTHVDSLTRFPLWYTVALKIGSQLMGYAPQVYGPARAVAAGDDEWYYGWPETYEFRVMNRDATVRRIVRRAWEPAPVTDADRQRYRDFMLGPDPGPQPMPRKLAPVESMVYPEHFPAFRRIAAGPAGYVWVQRFVPEWITQMYAFNSVPDVPTTWDVFDPSGAWLGGVTFPARFDVFDIGEDYVVGLWKDEFDVERVREYELLKQQ